MLPLPRLSNPSISLFPFMGQAGGTASQGFLLVILKESLMACSDKVGHINFMPELYWLKVGFVFSVDKLLAVICLAGPFWKITLLCGNMSLLQWKKLFHTMFCAIVIAKTTKPEWGKHSFECSYENQCKFTKSMFEHSTDWLSSRLLPIKQLGVQNYCLIHSAPER